LFISSPERIKNGMAKSAKLSSPVAIRCDTVVNAGMAGILTSIVSREENAMLQATGVPMAKRPKKLSTRTNNGILSIIVPGLKGPIFYNI
jgi:hypothetical protein